ncbi:lectin-like domain-containing protein [Larkinella arboricola]
MRSFLLLVLLAGYLTGFPTFLYGQYRLMGNAQPGQSDNCYVITTDTSMQAGAVWNTQPIDLSESHTWEFTVNLGHNPEGGEGLVFVLQAQNLDALGGRAGSLGYTGIRPSIGIEFDTDTGNFDNIAINKNGTITHDLAGPVPAFSNFATLKDGRDHFVRIEWNAAATTLRIFLDCELKMAKTVDLVKNIFADHPQVWWGMTGSTGPESNANTQRVCFQVPACSPVVYIPDVFSPNADGTNDHLEIKTKDELTIELTVFNRWGEIVFQSHSLENTWNGTYQNIECAPGTYTYKLTYQRADLTDSPIYQQTGHVLLVR